MADRIYFLVGADSPVLEVIDAALALDRVYQKAVWAFAREFGCEKIYVTQQWQVRLLGLAFEGDIPPGWRLNARKGYSTPDSRTKEGKEIGVRMKALPHGVSAQRFSSMLDEKIGQPKKSYTHWEDGVSWTVFEKHGSQYVLSVPAASKVSPPGCRELKMSEYWKIREAAEGKIPTRGDSRAARGERKA